MRQTHENASLTRQMSFDERATVSISALGGSLAARWKREGLLEPIQELVESDESVVIPW
jgi:hypothetical protein